MLTPSVASGRGCDAVRSLSFAACDGELTDADFVAIDAHLARCAACRARYTTDAVFLRAIRNAVRLEVAPQSLRDRLAHMLHPRAAQNAST